MKHVLAAAALAAFLAVPVSANCIPAKLAGTFNEANYVYINMGPEVTSPNQLVGSFYALGNTSANNGTYGANEWLFIDLNGLLSMQANLGDARVNGCPAGKLITRIYTTSTNPIRFLTMTSNEGEAGTTSAFDYSFGRVAGSIRSAVPLPRPRAMSSARMGPAVLVTWLIDPTSGGNTGDSSGTVTGYELVRAVGTSDPGRNPSAWSVVATVASDGSQTILSAPANCANIFADEFFATRLLFSDGQKSQVVSLSTRVNCHPALAEPDFRIVPKHPSGPRKPSP
jgi:hypothetical protein